MHRPFETDARTRDWCYFPDHLPLEGKMERNKIPIGARRDRNGWRKPCHYPNYIWERP